MYHFKDGGGIPAAACVSGTPGFSKSYHHVASKIFFGVMTAVTKLSACKQSSEYQVT